MEGISNEAASLAGHWGLGKLICLYDDNKISIDGHTEISFTEDVNARYDAMGWHTQWVKDGNTDLDAIRNAIEEAKKVTDKPSLIKVSTLIGYGSPNKADTHGVHGSPLGKLLMSAIDRLLAVTMSIPPDCDLPDFANSRPLKRCHVVTILQHAAIPDAQPGLITQLCVTSA